MRSSVLPADASTGRVVCVQYWRSGCWLSSYSEFTLSDLGVFLGVVGGIMTSILLTIQKSKCKKIKCCGCECDRDPTLATDKAKLAGKDGDDKP